MRERPPHAATAAFWATPGPPVVLVGGLPSGAGVADVLEAGARPPGSAPTPTAPIEGGWRLETRRWPRDAAYPYRESATLDIDAATACGTTGRLKLLFFNDRLYEAQFVPQDPQRCLRQLRRQYPGLKAERNGRDTWTDGALRLACNLRFADSTVGQALHAQAWVIWQDQRLRRQLDDWDARFGAVPAQPEVEVSTVPSSH